MLLIISALLGLSAILLGAGGAHLLSQGMDSNQRSLFQLANNFHLTHALLLAVLGVLKQNFTTLWLNISATLITLGIFLFSGSLYLYATTQAKIFSELTPFGGMCLIAGWIVFAIAGVNIYKQQSKTT